MGSIGQLSQPPQIAIETEGVPPPSCIYVDQSNNLVVRVGASTAFTLLVAARYMLADGSVSINSWPFAVIPQRANQTFSVPLSEGFLLGITAYATNKALARGQAYVSLTLSRDTPTNQVWPQRMAQGWVTEYSHVYWPSERGEECYSGYGNIRSIVGTTPAAGAEISEAVTANAIWRLKSFYMVLTTSATVANRNVHVTFDDGTNLLVDSTASLAVAAGVAVAFSLVEGLGSAPTVDGVQPVRMPVGFLLRPAWRIQTRTTNLQAGDQWSLVHYVVEEWFTG